MKTKFLIGIDEAGRGPLAGPVAVGAVMCSRNFDFKLLRGIKDSKQLTPNEREMWFEKAKKWNRMKVPAQQIFFHVSLIGPKTIDERGISYAIRKAIKNCLRKVKNADSENAGPIGRTIKPTQCQVLLDGALKAPPEFIFQKTIIRGDEKEPIISLASIMAKVTRDRLMVRLAKKIPGYAFEIHKGYGTALHRKNIEKQGFSDIHRRSFCNNLKPLQNI